MNVPETKATEGYDSLVRQLQVDSRRVRAAERLKTPEELAKDQRDHLQVMLSLFFYNNFITLKNLRHFFNCVRFSVKLFSYPQYFSFLQIISARLSRNRKFMTTGD